MLVSQHYLKLGTIITFVLLLLLVPAIGSGWGEVSLIGSEDGDGMHCETTSRSPNNADVQTVLDYMKALPGPQLCCQNNCDSFGSYCTTMHKAGSAAVAFCTPWACENDNTVLCFPCTWITFLLEGIQSSCIANIGGVDRVGGWLRTTPPPDKGLYIYDVAILNSKDG